ncbi:RNA 2',3'-cyclic phosphodiesterase [Streptomyces sp. NPDC002088]|uniref:RNA 2',3'-cyclic phosphodiesterase n=1 Tax=Streptomyces sp. NPDC002088 TaxID=3154665 RepID=UPI00332CEC88
MPSSCELGAEVDALRKLPGAEGLRWTGRAGWHFTLAFYGEVDEAVVPELSARLERAAHRTRPFPPAVKGGGRFGHGRAVWARAHGDRETLRLLADRVEAAGRKARVETGEHRRYHTHLTVARSRDAVDVRPYLEVLDRFASRTWTVEELGLVRSSLPKSGVPGEQPRYEVVGRWALGGAGQA